MAKTVVCWFCDKDFEVKEIRRGIHKGSYRCPHCNSLGWWKNKRSGK